MVLRVADKHYKDLVSQAPGFAIHQKVSPPRDCIICFGSLKGKLYDIGVTMATAAAVELSSLSSLR